MKGSAEDGANRKQHQQKHAQTFIASRVLIIPVKRWAIIGIIQKTQQYEERPSFCERMENVIIFILTN